MTTLTQQQITNLENLLNANNVAGFYLLLEGYGDPYGRLGAADEVSSPARRK